MQCSQLTLSGTEQLCGKTKVSKYCRHPEHEGRRGFLAQAGWNLAVLDSSWVLLAMRVCNVMQSRKSGLKAQGASLSERDNADTKIGLVKVVQH